MVLNLRVILLDNGGKMNLFEIDPDVRNTIKASNAMDSTLLITGETGTGKSHLAEIIHATSRSRSHLKLHKINIACLTESIIESELFGHEKGSFTGADKSRIGKLEAANGGTVFLDEIGELPLRLQTKLLDFIQYKKITPVGGNREIELDIRIVAATNKNLEELIEKGEFREDLYHRLNVFRVHLEGISQNHNLIKKLSNEILLRLNTKSRKNIKMFSSEVMQCLLHHKWKGNIRELEHVIEYAVAMENSECLQIHSLPKRLKEQFVYDEKLNISSEDTTNKGRKVQVDSMIREKTIQWVELPLTMNFHETKEIFERTYIEEVLGKCQGQINLTSRSIGLNKVSLVEKIKKYQIDWKRIRIDQLGPALQNH